MLDRVVEHLTGSTFTPCFGRRMQFVSGGEILRFSSAQMVLRQKVSFSVGECVRNALQCIQYPD